MTSIYDYTEYRLFLNEWILRQANGGWGIKGQLASTIGISSTMVSLVLKGDKELSMEQAAEVVDFLGLSENEGDYFLLLVELGRAGSTKLQQRLHKRIRQTQQLSKKISKRVQKDIELSEEAKNIYYSSWVYTAIRNLTALEGQNNIRRIASRLQQPPQKVAQVVDFLLENQLCKKNKNGLTYGPAHTHLDSDSIFVTRHHQNWRIRGFTEMNENEEDNLFYTCPMSLSEKAVKEIRKALPTMIENILKIVRPSKSEQVYCLNIDWFQY